MFLVEISKTRLGKWGDPKNQDCKSRFKLKLATRRFQHFWKFFFKYELKSQKVQQLEKAGMNLVTWLSLASHLCSRLLLNFILSLKCLGTRLAKTSFCSMLMYDRCAGISACRQERVGMHCRLEMVRMHSYPTVHRHAQETHPSRASAPWGDSPVTWRWAWTWRASLLRYRASPTLSWPYLSRGSVSKATATPPLKYT